MLVSNNNIAKYLETNAMNTGDLTPLEMFRQLPRDLDTRDIGQLLGRVRATNVQHQHQHQQYLGSNMRYIALQIPREIPNGIRNALLVVAVLIATATYQAGLSPPGGVRQDTYMPPILNGTNTNLTQGPPHYAGQAVMGLKSFLIFMVFNSIGFNISLLMISILTLGLPLYRLVLLLLFSLMSTYIASTAIITPNGGFINIFIHVFLDFLFVLLVIFMLFSLKIVKYVKKTT